MLKIWIKKNGDYAGWAAQQDNIIKTSLLPDKSVYLLKDINLSLPYNNSLRGWNVASYRNKIEKICKIVKKMVNFVCVWIVMKAHLKIIHNLLLKVLFTNK